MSYPLWFLPTTFHPLNFLPRANSTAPKFPPAVLPAGCQPCVPVCESVFDRVVVSYLIRGGTQVSWELLPTFTDPSPLVFQLQVGTTGNPDADDWEDVGLPVQDQFTAIDPDQRVYGKSNWTHYRVVLTSPKGVYYSTPVAGLGILDRRDWRRARNLVRQRLKIYRYQEGQEGYLLKRRVTGQRCPVCIDLQTGECRNPNCLTCYGTGFTCGYFFPIGCSWVKMSPKAYREKLDGRMRGTVNDMVARAEMVLVDMLVEDDLFIVKKTDDRFFVHSVQHTAEIRGVPIVANVELRLAPFTSPVYDIPVPDQLDDLLIEAF